MHFVPFSFCWSNKTLVAPPHHLAHRCKIVHAVTVFTWNLRYSAFFIVPSSHTTIDATVSVPWMCEMSKHSIRRGSFSSVSASVAPPESP